MNYKKDDGYGTHDKHQPRELKRWKGFNVGDEVTLYKAPVGFKHFENKTGTIHSIHEPQSDHSKAWFFFQIHEVKGQNLKHKVSEANTKARGCAHYRQHNTHDLELIKVSIQGFTPPKCGFTPPKCGLDLLQDVAKIMPAEQVVQASSVEAPPTGLTHQAVVVKPEPVVENRNVEAPPTGLTHQAVVVNPEPVVEARNVEAPPHKKPERKRKLDNTSNQAEFDVNTSKREQRKLQVFLDRIDVAGTKKSDGREDAGLEKMESHKPNLVGTKILKQFYNKNNLEYYEGVVTAMSIAEGRDFFRFPDGTTSQVSYHVRYPATADQPEDDEEMSPAHVLQYSIKPDKGKAVQK
jgi:hypothetical protein